MARGKAAAIDLTETERGELDGLLRRHGTAQALALRARIVLLAAAGLTNSAIAAGLGIDQHTVGKWRNRFASRHPHFHSTPVQVQRYAPNHTLLELFCGTRERGPGLPHKPGIRHEICALAFYLMPLVVFPLIAGFVDVLACIARPYGDLRSCGCTGDGEEKLSGRGKNVGGSAEALRDGMCGREDVAGSDPSAAAPRPWCRS